jgi:hypothetical protein
MEDVLKVFMTCLNLLAERSSKEVEHFGSRGTQKATPQEEELYGIVLDAVSNKKLAIDHAQELFTSHEWQALCAITHIRPDRVIVAADIDISVMSSLMVLFDTERNGLFECDMKLCAEAALRQSDVWLVSRYVQLWPEMPYMREAPWVASDYAKMESRHIADFPSLLKVLTLPHNRRQIKLGGSVWAVVSDHIFSQDWWGATPKLERCGFTKGLIKRYPWVLDDLLRPRDDTKGDS